MDERYAHASSSERASARSEERDQEPVKALAAAWFEPVWEVRQDAAVVHGWRFKCPFCGEHRESSDYRETYARAYRHLESCEWTDRNGLGAIDGRHF